MVAQGRTRTGRRMLLARDSQEWDQIALQRETASNLLNSLFLLRRDLQNSNLVASC
jgi:hypothetical protein